MPMTIVVNYGSADAFEAYALDASDVLEVLAYWLERGYTNFNIRPR